MYYNLFNQCPIDGHLGKTTTNNTCTYVIGVCKYIYKINFQRQKCCQRVYTFETLVYNAKLPSIGIVSIYTPQQYKKMPISPYLGQDVL